MALKSILDSLAKPQAAGEPAEAAAQAAAGGGAVAAAPAEDPSASFSPFDRSPNLALIAYCFFVSHQCEDSAPAWSDFLEASFNVQLLDSKDQVASAMLFRVFPVSPYTFTVVNKREAVEALSSCIAFINRFSARVFSCMVADMNDFLARHRMDLIGLDFNGVPDSALCSVVSAPADEEQRLEEQAEALRLEAKAGALRSGAEEAYSARWALLEQREEEEKVSAALTRPCV